MNKDSCFRLCKRREKIYEGVCMKEEFQLEQEISILDILKALLSKIVYLILALVLGAIAGGVYGHVTSHDVKYYGTSLNFYVNPSKDDGSGTTDENNSIYAVYGSYSTNVMDNIIKCLESETFAAELLDGMITSDVDGMPAKYTVTAEGEQVLTDGYKGWLSTVAGAVTFSYKSDSSTNIANSFIYVNIHLNGAVNNGKGKAVAEAISRQVQVSVPEYVELNMPKPSGYTSTNCILMTVLTDVHQTNSGYTASQTTKYAMIAGVIAFLIAAVIVIVLDRSDKRLRDIDVLTKSFNLPILGVIPSIGREIEKKRKEKGENV